MLALPREGLVVGLTSTVLDSFVCVLVGVAGVSGTFGLD